MPTPSHLPLQPGDPMPFFTARTSRNPRYKVDVAAGRYLLIAFVGRTSHPMLGDAAKRLVEAAHRFDGERAAAFLVTVDPADEALVTDRFPGMRWLFDTDWAISRLYGAADETRDTYQPLWVLVDPGLRVHSVGTCADLDSLFEILDALPPPADHAGVPMLAPVLVAPRIFEQELCRDLIALYAANGGEDSGFMREVDGRTSLVVDHTHKRRRDCQIEDEALKGALQFRIRRRLVPQIKRAFQFDVTRMERYLVACYDAAEGGHFNPHRDNTTKGTAHRRFAVSINLNAEEYEGGDLIFPEFGPRTYRAPTGGAVVFSCSLLHQATTVTRGKRYCFLPFLYDDAAAAIREANNVYLDDSVGAYHRDM